MWQGVLLLCTGTAGTQCQPYLVNSAKPAPLQKFEVGCMALAHGCTHCRSLSGEPRRDVDAPGVAVPEHVPDLHRVGHHGNTSSTHLSPPSHTLS